MRRQKHKKGIIGTGLFIVTPYWEYKRQELNFNVDNHDNENREHIGKCFC